MFGLNAGNGIGFLVSLFLFVAAIMAVFVPFWVFRIRNEIILTNKRLEEMISLLKERRPE